MKQYHKLQIEMVTVNKPPVVYCGHVNCGTVKIQQFYMSTSAVDWTYTERKRP